MRRLFCVLLIVLVCFLPVVAEAVDKYVRKAASPGGDGSTWTLAYQDFSSVSVSALAGSTLWIAAGTYTTGLPYMNNIDNVTIKRATIASHGGAGGWSDTFDGQVTIAPTGGRFIDADLCDNFLMDGMNNNPWLFKIKGVKDPNGMFLFESSSNSTVRNVDFDGNYEGGVGIEDGIRGGGLTDFVVEYSTIQNYAHYGCGSCGHNDGVAIGDAIRLTFRYNIFRDNGQHMILGAFNWYGGFVQDLKIYYNVFYNTNATGAFDTPSYNTLVFSGTSGTMFIENNTFALRSSLHGFRSVINDEGSGTGSPTPNVIAGRVWRNNVLQDSLQGNVADSGTKSNNTYFSGSGSIPAGETNGATTNPLFTNYAGNDYSLQSGSPAIGTGVNAGYSTDILAHAVSNPPDRGAYQFLSAGDTTPPSTVTGLIVTATGFGQTNVSWTAATDNVAVNNYSVERCQGVGCSSFIVVASPITTSLVETGLVHGASYSYRVKAVDTSTNLSASYSSTASAVTNALLSITNGGIRASGGVKVR